jgi:hypothetical protein
MRRILYEITVSECINNVDPEPAVVEIYIPLVYSYWEEALAYGQKESTTNGQNTPTKSDL